MFIELTNFETGCKFICDPAQWLFTAPRSDVLKVADSPRIVLMSPVLNPTIGIPVKENYDTVKARIKKAALFGPIASEKQGGE